MSTLGYAIAFMLCEPNTGPCETIALRASRFTSLAQCVSSASEALRAMPRSQAQASLVARCRSLEEVCQPRLVAHAPIRPPQLLHRARAEPARSSRAALEAALALLCTPPPAEGGC